MSLDSRGDLGSWVAYLKDIGVRELRVPAPASRVRKPARAPRAAPRTVAKPIGKPVAKPVARTVVKEPAPPPERRAAPAVSDEQVARLAAIRTRIGDCTRCKLHAGRTKLVFGVGSPAADLMFIGEGPGRDEDLRGEPFVGRAGKKLDEMIDAIGFAREEVYIANIVKCRPPKNRDPERDEIETCSPFLFAQIEAIRPKVIVTLGGPATKTLLETKVGITRLRGQWQTFRGVPVMPTFHPAFVLRNYTPETRRQVWEDLKAARARVDQG